MEVRHVAEPFLNNIYDRFRFVLFSGADGPEQAECLPLAHG